LNSPTLVRCDSKPRNWSQEILTSLFAAYVYSSFPEQVLHEINAPLGATQFYEADYWKHLQRNYTKLFSRSNSLSVVKVTSANLENGMGYESFRRPYLNLIKDLYPKINNHGYLAFIIDPIRVDGESLHWMLYGDLVLYAEKHLSEKFVRYFFRPQNIAEATLKHIPQIDCSKAEFDSINIGFSYIDCFVLDDGDEQRLLVLFQKNQADETLIPCPKCRSNQVQGNSYSSMGVRSWECRNQLCPDRSKFNRGKRYSFLQLLKNEAIKNKEHIIPRESVKSWIRDVQPRREDHEVLEMLIRHYTLAGDTIHVFNLSKDFAKGFGRTLIFENIECSSKLSTISEFAIDPSKFFDSSYFHRFIVEKTPRKTDVTVRQIQTEQVRSILGDAFEVLGSIKEGTIDGAVTSPPYYNAREYSQWENIYNYLYEMYNINKEVYRVLKDGGVYLFNIFDYFDNEKNISLSAMGKKRMILGAYTLDIFRRIGFKCLGNIVWDKGDIEGKRGFNNGNFSPYYQSPFNCWEHIFIFVKKLKHNSRDIRFPNYLRQKPVFKMIRGKNRYGHTAPFPVEIPLLITERLGDNGVTVLDPFAGSMTTGVAALRSNIHSICIEKDEQFFEVGLEKLNESIAQGVLI
jgi:DNA modification methylase